MSDTYIDFEPPAWYEVDAVVQNGSATMSQVLGDPCGRGNIVARCNVVGTSGAYVEKNFTHTVSPGESLYMGFFLKANVSANGAWITQLVNSGSPNAAIYLLIKDETPGWKKWMGYCKRDGGINTMPQWIVDSYGKWDWFVLQIKRATIAANDGEYHIYQNGVLRSSRTGEDNYDSAGQSAWKCTVGAFAGGQDGLNLDFDEVKISTSYPEPYAPTPETDYPESRRTVVLYRQASSDSREFADYCVDQMGVPRCNLCPLPNATVNETLADYATFQTEIETDLAAWLALNPTVAANCSTFLIGYGVPGYFTHGGVKHSATSRLMNYGTAFSSQTANPFYNPATVGRLTIDDLRLANVYLCSRIDADTLAHAKDVLDCGLQIAGCGLNDSDKLYSDESDYLASLNCQHLRIQTDSIGEYINDAFAWGATGAGFSDGGIRACFTDDSANTGDTLRATSELFDAIIINGYASGLGNSETADTFDIDSFFEMLRIGGTLAEALAVSIANLDYTAVTVGLPTITVAFQVGGYNVYHGQVQKDQIDYDTPVAYLRAGVAQVDLVDFALAEDVDHYFGVRAVSSEGVEEENTTVTTRARIESGQLIGPPPNRIASALATAIAAGKIDLAFRYNARGQAAVASAIQVAQIVGGEIDWSSLLTTVSITGTCRKSVELGPFDHGQTVRLALRAVTAGGVAGAVFGASPVVADTTGPAAVDYLSVSQEGSS